MIKPKLHVDLQWLNIISYSLERFRPIKKEVSVCRCPICGDSKKNKRITRFYFYQKKGNLLVYCHNCGYSHSFYRFMKDQFPLRFEEYKRETLFDAFKPSQTLYGAKDLGTNTTAALSTPNNTQSPVELHRDIILKDCYRLYDLDDTHEAKEQMISRLMGPKELKRLYYTPDFKEFASRIDPDAAKDLKTEERIIIPFINKDGIVEMVQGRSLDPNTKLRYLTIKANEDVEKTYGLYEVDPGLTVYCVEGPLDSLFIDNCLASCDANLTRVEADVYIWDNQNRNKSVIKYMEEAIESGKNLVIWPPGNNSKLDINDMIVLGMTRENLMELIRQRTYSGLLAKAQFMRWKKI